MNKRWEINRVSTPERTFDKINNEMAQPIGIVLFGADCDLKDDVYMRCVEQIRNLAVGYGGKSSMPLNAAAQAFSEGKNVLTVMTGDSSIYQTYRHEVVTRLRELGAKSVIGIYAKVDKTPHCKNVADWNILHRQIETLLQKPPTADGLDYLLIANEEEG